MGKVVYIKQSYILKSILVSLIFILLGISAYPQDKSDKSDDSTQTVVSIYLDCRRCDADYFRRELNYINFVRDRKQADVHILITTRQTASGGDEFSIEFIGQQDFKGIIDTLHYITLNDDTDDIIRKGLLQHVKLGLVRYIARTPSASDLKVRYTQQIDEATRVDKWNYWVFSVEANTWLNGQKTYRNLNLWWNIDASRVTEDLKLEFEIRGNYNEQKFDYGDFNTLSLSQSLGGNVNIVFSLSNHWSWGIKSGVSSSTYSNTDLRAYSSLALEYNIFPYEQSSQRELRLSYRLSQYYSDYKEVTVYDKINEWNTSESISSELTLIQPWGSINTSLGASHYFRNIRYNKIYIDGYISIRMIEGLSFRINGYASWVHDQLSLRKGDASDEEVILRRRELETSYSYYVSFGFNYTFGSIYNNIVNPRFGN